MILAVVLIVFGVLLLALLVFWMIGERGRLMLPSTWKTMRAGGLKRMIDGSSIHAYIYGRWLRRYLDRLFNRVYPRQDAEGMKRLADHYHGKVITHEQAEAIVSLDHDIPLQDLEQIIPYPMARDLVLKGPPDVAVFECACRHIRANSCKPTLVCMVIGQPFVDFLLEHHPNDSRRLTQEEALKLLQEEYERGHLHSAWFKDVMFNRFYSICNCCKCCCGGIETMVKHGAPLMVSSGYVAKVDESLCKACSTCVKACPFNAIQIENDTAVVDWETCMGCGVCVGQCPRSGLTLLRDERKGEPLDVRLLETTTDKVEKA